MPKKKISDYERFMSLSDAEKEAEFAKYDGPIDPSRTRPLTAAERRSFERWRRKAKVGRPKKGQGAHVISLSIERSLLTRADRYARKHKMTRAALFAKAIEAMLPGAA
jgi:hypothetical protein